MKKRRKNDLNEEVRLPVQHVDFETAVKLFLNEQRIKKMAPHTIRWHTENLHTLKKALEEQQICTDPETITERVLKHNYILYMLDGGLKSSTINGRIRTCHAFFGYLEAERMIENDPAKNITLLKMEKVIIQTFSKEQVQSLLKAPNTKTFTGYRDYCIQLLLLETGMRLSELVNLKLQDVNLKDGHVKVMGKGSKERLVPFQRTMKKVLQKYISLRGEEAQCDNLFVSIDNDPMTTRNVQDRLTKYGRKSGVTNVRVSPHTYRHSFAKFYILAGGDIFSLQKILGHNSLDMVRYYVELFRSEVAQQHAKYSPIERMRLDG